MVPPRSYVPWWLEHTDLVPANEGEAELARDLMVGNGKLERHLGLVVTATYDPSLVLGMIAIRCERHRDGDAKLHEIPISMSIPETPMCLSTPRRTEPQPQPVVKRPYFYPPQGEQGSD